MRTKIYVYVIFLTILCIALLGMACAVGLFLEHAFLEDVTRLALDQIAIKTLPPDFYFSEKTFSATLFEESIRNLKSWAIFVVPCCIIVMGYYWRDQLFGGLTRRWHRVTEFGEGLLFLTLIYWVLLGVALVPFQFAPIDVLSKSEARHLLMHGAYDISWVNTLLTWNGTLWGIMGLTTFLATLIWFFRSRK